MGGKAFTFVMMLGVLPAVAGNYAFFDPDETGNRLWSYSDAWFTCGDYKNDQTQYRSNIQPLGEPGDGKMLMMDSNLLTPATPLKIDDGRRVVVNQMFMAYYIGSPYGDEPHMVALEVGDGATLTTQQPNSNFQIGSCERGQALMLVDAGAIVSNANFQIGAAGLGIVTNRGGLVVAKDNNSQRGMFLGYSATGTGTYAQVSGSLNVSRCWIGRNGVGRMEILGGGMSGTTYLGDQPGGQGSAVFSGVVVSNATTVGCAENSSGWLQLRGATNLTDSVTIRSKATAYGQLRGWGSIYRYSSNSTCGEMNNFFMNGQTFADGEGVDGRLLDLRLIRTGDGGKYSNVKVTIPNGVDGTNGWYAVNKGVLAYPMIYVRGAQWTGTFGANTNEYCDAVNTVRIDYNQSANKGPWIESQLYANDSSFVPAGLPGKPLGVWGFRSNVKYDNRASQLANLQDFSLRFRYDHRKLKAGAHLSLMRYDQAACRWRRIARTAHDPASPFISATALAADGADYDRNLGIFAVAKDDVGLAVIVR